MTNFKNQEDPQIIPNLSSDHAFDTNNNNTVQNQKPVNFNKRDSASFKETKVLFPQANTIPDVTKGKEVRPMPKIEYTEEKVIPRPISAKDIPLKIEIEEKDETPSFTKSVTGPMKEQNPTLALFQNAKTSEEEIKIEEVPLKVEKKKQKKQKKQSKFTKWIVIGIILEVLVLGVVIGIKTIGTKEIVECTGEEYNSYYEANIVNTKKYTFRNGKIVKLEDTYKYVFDNQEAYETFKNNYANPPKEVIEGRIFTSNINDNENIYEEKTLYDYKKLRSQNTSSDTHNIVISTSNEDDTISLLDYNITDIKIIYEEDYICR
jgi:hypothetical protein